MIRSTKKYYSLKFYKIHSNQNHFLVFFDVFSEHLKRSSLQFQLQINERYKGVMRHGQSSKQIESSTMLLMQDTIS